MIDLNSTKEALRAAFIKEFKEKIVEKSGGKKLSDFNKDKKAYDNYVGQEADKLLSSLGFESYDAIFEAYFKKLIEQYGEQALLNIEVKKVDKFALDMSRSLVGSLTQGQLLTETTFGNALNSFKTDMFTHIDMLKQYEKPLKQNKFFKTNPKNEGKLNADLVESISEIVNKNERVKAKTSLFA